MAETKRGPGRPPGSKNKTKNNNKTSTAQTSKAKEKAQEIQAKKKADKRVIDEIWAIITIAIGAFLAYRKLHSLAQKSNDTASIARGMLKSTRTALIICLVAVTLNAVSFVIMFPVIEQMLQSGDFASIAGNMSAGTAAGTSTWG